MGFDCHFHHPLSVQALLKVLVKGLKEELDECHHKGCKVLSITRINPRVVVSIGDNNDNGGGEVVKDRASHVSETQKKLGISDSK